MTPVIHQVPVAASAAEAARLMIDQHIHRLVVTQGKEPVGIITSMDLLKVVAEQGRSSRRTQSSDALTRCS